MVAEVIDIIPRGRGAKVLAGAGLDAVEEKEFQVVGLLDFVARSRGHLAVAHGLDQVGGHQHDELFLDPLAARIAEEGPDDRQVAQAGDAVGLAGERQLQQAGDGQGLPLAELDGGLRIAGVQAGDRATAGDQGDGDGGVDVADLGGKVSRMTSPSRM